MNSETIKIVLASGNRKKLQELQAILQGRSVRLLPQTDFDLPEAIEDGHSFVENAIIKARHAARLTGLPAIADDSGIEVDALGGAPGIYSARFAERAGMGRGDAANNALLVSELAARPGAGRSARFQCAIALMRFADDPMPLVCQGTWEGVILHEEAGENGFGYDPLFFVPTHGCSSAQLDPEVKNTISHRGRALAELLERWPFNQRM